MTLRANLERMERIKCKICEEMVENVEEHLIEQHKNELEQARLTEKADNVSIWIRQQTGGQIKVRKVTIFENFLFINDF